MPTIARISASTAVTALPAPVARFRDVALAGNPPAVETVAIKTTAWMRRPGMPRIPLEIRMIHRLGHDFVHDIRVGRGRLSFRFGLDAYVDGHGLMKVGPAVQSGIEFDQGALIALWGEALGFPSAWQDRSDIRWEPVDDQTAILVVPGPEGDIPITVGFDPATGLPAYCEADRYKATGPKVHWRGASSDWRRFEGGVLAPGRFTVQWADEPFPWIDIRTKAVRVNVPVDGALELGRRALLPSPRRGRRSALVDLLKGIPFFLATPFVRRWHLRWGATPDEIAAELPGDELLRRAQFNATRAITIDAPPERVWPWIRQIGFRRAGFYSYDLLDNLGRPSADEVVPELQLQRVGDWVAMAEPVNDVTAFRVHSFEPNEWTVWHKPDSTWTWRLEPLDGGQTRLITRLKCRYEMDRPTSALLSIFLIEFGDFPMMRRLLLGLKERAEGRTASESGL